MIPPIGAQGLNLGLRDAATIGELAVEAHRAGRDIGGINVLTRYDSMRRSDIAGRTLAIDLVNRSLLSDFLPVQGARGFRPLSHRPHRPVAPRADARRRRAALRRSRG